MKNSTKHNFWAWVAFRLPNILKYHAALAVAAFATTGKYSNTEVPALTVIDAARRFADDHKII